METLITVISTIATWLVSKEYLLPQITKLINWIKERKKQQDQSNIDSTKELIEIKHDSNEVYESQIKFLMSQIESFESELISYQTQLETLRKKILELNNTLYNKSLVIGKLRQYCCSNEDCKFRVFCSDEFCNLTTLTK